MPLCYFRHTLSLISGTLETIVPPFLIIGLVMFVCLFGCAPSSQPLSNEMSSDSLLMVDRIDSALRMPDKRDSLLVLARQQLENQPALQDTYRFSYSRFLLLNGNLGRAREQIALAMADFGTDSLAVGLAKYHNLLAAVEAYDNAQSESVYHFQQAIRLYEMHGDDRQAAVIRFNLANIFFSRHDYETAYKYSQEAKGALEEARDTANLTLCLSVLSIAATNLGHVDEAKRYASAALEWAASHTNLQGTIFSNYAMGEVELANKAFQVAIQRFSLAIELGESQGVLQWLVPIRATLLRAYLESGNFKEAVSAGEKLIEQATLFNNRDVLYSAHKNMALALESLGQYVQAYTSMKEAEELYRENMSVANERVVHDMLVKYEAERQSNTILKQESKLAKQRMWGVAILAGAAAFVFGLGWVWRNSQQKNKLLVKEKESAILQALNRGEEQERKRLAQELHDGVASNLVALKLQIEDWDAMSPESMRVLELVNKTHVEIRKVAQNLSPIDFNRVTLPKAIEAFAQRCTNERCDVIFHTNINEQADNFSHEMALMVYRAMQELVQNALKHAEASVINVQLMAKNREEFVLSIEDDGRGFPVAKGLPYTGVLYKLFRRLEKTNMDIDFESYPGSGTSVFINFKTDLV